MGNPQIKHLESQIRGRSQELEAFIQDWHRDEASYDLARQMGEFLLQFIAYLELTGLFEQTIRKHLRNCWCIGKLECDYGYHDTFSRLSF